jgi:hypothetical protein
MQDFVHKQNIERLRRQLAEERDPERRKTIAELLADHERGGDGIRHKDHGRDGEA